MAIRASIYYRRDHAADARPRPCFSVIACLLPLLCPAAQASSLDDLPDDQVAVSIVTMGPGDAVYERFGHNAIWLHRHGAQLSADDDSVLYNYGIFSFEDENFIGRFIRGRMEYWMDVSPAASDLASYVKQGRSLWVQDLDLSPQQTGRLRRILKKQTLEHYRYDYYTANCSTRLRDAIDEAIDWQIKKQLGPRPSDITFRYDTRRLMAPMPPLYAALCFVLGPVVDRPISQWEECYLPQHLQDRLQHLQITDERGYERPLVTRSWPLYPGVKPPERSTPPNWWPLYLLVGLPLGGVFTLLAWLLTRKTMNDARGTIDAIVHRPSFIAPALRALLALLSALWLLFIAFLGVFAVSIWVFTSHVAAYRNENILQFSPLAIPLIVLVPAWALGRRWLDRWTLWITFAVAGGSLLGLLIKVLPWSYQVNWDMIALALPANLGLAAAVYLLSRPPAQPAQPPASSSPASSGKPPRRKQN